MACCIAVGKGVRGVVGICQWTKVREWFVVARGKGSLHFRHTPRILYLNLAEAPPGFVGPRRVTGHREPPAGSSGGRTRWESVDRSQLLQGCMLQRFCDRSHASRGRCRPSPTPFFTLQRPLHRTPTFADGIQNRNRIMIGKRSRYSATAYKEHSLFDLRHLYSMQFDIRIAKYAAV